MPKGYPVQFSTTQIDELIRLYETGITIKQAARELGISFGAVQNIFHRINYKPRQAHRKYTDNEHAFDSIDNELAAYWLGFIYADGHVQRTSLTIGLAAKDGHHLARFAEFMCSSTPTTFFTPRDDYPKSRITVSGVHLSARLRELGILVNRPIPDVVLSDIERIVWEYADDKKARRDLAKVELEYMKEINS